MTACMLNRCIALAGALFIATVSSGCGVISSFRNDDTGPVPVKVARYIPSAEVAREDLIRSSKLRGPMMVATAEPVRALPQPVLGVTPEVQRELDQFVKRERATVELIMEQRAAHHNQLVEVFADEGVPVELVNLAGIESRFNPLALSRAGARGMWQFMKSTARIYGLTVSKSKDERTDPILSSIAAARHLRDLFNSYQDWHLALAAYNAGPGRIDKALKTSRKRCFWDISRSGTLARETERFVPKFIALSLIMNNPEQYGFADPEFGHQNAIG